MLVWTIKGRDVMCKVSTAARQRTKWSLAKYAGLNKSCAISDLLNKPLVGIMQFI